jgi:sugar transferase (PEP-CTERM system associated)
MGIRNTGKISTLTLVFGNLLISIGAFYTGIYLRFSEIESGLLKYQPSIFIKIIPFAAVLIFCSFFAELYNQEKRTGRKEIVLRCLIAGTCSFFALSALYYVLPSMRIWRGHLIISLPIFIVLQCLLHIAYVSFSRMPSFAKRVLILGVGRTAEKLGNLIGATNHNYVLSGYVSCPSESVAVPAYHVVGNGDGVFETALKQRANKIVISLSERRGVLPFKEILNCKMSGIDVLDAPSFYEEIAGKLFLENIRPSWFIFSDGFRITPLNKINKRMFDIVIATCGLLIAAPLIPIIALLIKIDSPGPIFFRQIRVGERETNFMLYKFRTMFQDAERGTGAVWAQNKDKRVTRVGTFLRKARLDEMPQLFNVLRGDMSFIGPRPERPEFVEKLKEIIPYYSERHFVKPGVTGWAQVKYRYGASIEDAIEKLRYDLYYIKNLSLFLDMLILIETIKVVLFGRGSR